MTFKITHQDNNARVGQLTTAHGVIETPFFMPVTTKATGKHITTDDYKKAKAVISNAFLLSLRPGIEIIKSAGGLHKFMNFNKVIFTDCGGFQMSRNIFQKKTKNGLHFRNPFDYNKIILTPKKIMEIQLTINSDVAMMLDDMSSYKATKEEAKTAMENTHRWGRESLQMHQELKKQKNSKQLLFGIIQGNFYPELREESAKFINSLDFDGIAIGGIAIGEPKEEMYKAVDTVLPFITKDKPKYVMGVGSPEELLNLIERGIDCFDSVYPTQTARHNTLFTKKGKLYIDSIKYNKDFTSIEDDCQCHTCKHYTKAYLHHLTKIKEPAANRLKSIHNIHFILNLMEETKKAIKENRFKEFKDNFIKRFKI
ncbi:MAG: tRNA guanosine(34) transglycosylase Tgt [Nanoarchaeota archaeon]